MDDIIWKKVYYKVGVEVSNYGIVRRIDTKKEYSISKDGRVKIMGDNYLVKHLVYAAFNDSFWINEKVMQLDGNVSNNSLNNLMLVKDFNKAVLFDLEELEKKYLDIKNEYERKKNINYAITEKNKKKA